MRSTPDQDERLRELLQAAVNAFAGGSADRFGQLIGYANGGYIREALNKKKPVREALIERVHAAKGMTDWFLPVLGELSLMDLGSADEAKLLAVFRSIPPASPARGKIIAYAQGMADLSGESGALSNERGHPRELAA